MNLILLFCTGVVMYVIMRIANPETVLLLPSCHLETREVVPLGNPRDLHPHHHQSLLPVLHGWSLSLLLRRLRSFPAPQQAWLRAPLRPQQRRVYSSRSDGASDEHYFGGDKPGHPPPSAVRSPLPIEQIPHLLFAAPPSLLDALLGAENGDQNRGSFRGHFAPLRSILHHERILRGFGRQGASFDFTPRNANLLLFRLLLLRLLRRNRFTFVQAVGKRR